MNARGSTDWWTWVQFAVLCASILANVVLWFRTRHLESAARVAEYNDRAWVALREFQKRSDESGSRAGDAILEPPVVDEQLELWRQTSEAVLGRWTEDVVSQVSELQSKLASYQVAMGSHPAASQFVRQCLKRAAVPTVRSLALLDGRIQELEQLLHTLDDAVGALPHPGPRKGPLIRLERVRAARERLGAATGMAEESVAAAGVVIE